MTKELRRKLDAKWINEFIAHHPAVHSELPAREAAIVALHDAEAAEPELMKRFGKGLVVKKIAELLGCIHQGDERGVRRVLCGLPEKLQLQLLQTIVNTFQKIAIEEKKPMRPRHRTTTAAQPRSDAHT